MDLKREVFICDCCSPEHQFIFLYDEEEKIVYLDVHLSNYRNFFQRIWAAIKYVFGYTSKYGDWDSTYLSKKELEKLKIFLQNIETGDKNV